ncbi:MAG: hypothetical protein LBT40_02895 [Deltaproteobacteria bacterium]|jgi:hypothetical protein|nr:hypothetical protein [Deltaproteobacteria bacterium]
MQSIIQKLSIYLIFITLVITAVISISPCVASAQEKLDLNLPIFIWNSYAYWSDTSNLEIKTYAFTIDYSLFDNANAKPISNLEIQTNIGNIIFNEPINFKAPYFMTGTLKSSQTPIEQFNVTKVLGFVDGKQVDLTENFRSSNFSPIPVEVMTPESTTCPRKLLDFAVYEGIYKELIIGDFQHAEIEFNGKSESFFFGDNVSYFFENEANINKRVKVFVENVQTILSDGETSDCTNVESITKFIELK